ncbi:MAG: phage holin family protein [Candidatus Sericytochromatia bacterium]
MIYSLLISTAAFLLASYLLPGFRVDNVWSAVMAAIALGLANAIIRPLVILFTLPLTVLTLGLFLLVVNGAVLALAVWLVPGVAVANLGWAIAAAVVISVINAVLGSVFN